VLRVGSGAEQLIARLQGLLRPFARFLVDCPISPERDQQQGIADIFRKDLLRGQNDWPSRTLRLDDNRRADREDEFLLRMDAVDSIERAGFTVYEASNADEAIRILETHHDIRVVFTDINMPGSMDGLKLAHYVRGRWPPIKLIITSGYPVPSGEELPEGAGYFTKPYQLEKVTRSIREITT